MSFKTSDLILLGGAAAAYFLVIKPVSDTGGAIGGAIDNTVKTAQDLLDKMNPFGAQGVITTTTGTVSAVADEAKKQAAYSYGVWAEHTAIGISAPESGRPLEAMAGNLANQVFYAVNPSAPIANFETTSGSQVYVPFQGNPVEIVPGMPWVAPVEVIANAYNTVNTSRVVSTPQVAVSATPPAAQSNFSAKGSTATAQVVTPTLSQALYTPALVTPASNMSSVSGKSVYVAPPATYNLLNKSK